MREVGRLNIANLMNENHGDFFKAINLINQQMYFSKIIATEETPI